MSSVKVAVRCRPFNAREKQLNAVLAVGMEDDGTVILNNPETETEEEYKYDYGLWSHDTSADNFMTQDKLFDIIGMNLLTDFWDDMYNVCLFAYGQSGSGKSYSMTGDREDRSHWGIIPRLCETVLQNVERDTNKYQSFVVKVGMLEIYLDKIQDLLIPRKDRPNEGLEIMSNRVKDLRMVPVTKLDEIMAALERGQSQQTIAATGLNARSSRAHTIFELILEKTIHNPDAPRKKDRKVVQTASMRLVDLAGSEKVDKVREGVTTGAITVEQLAQRELEGRAINNSLMSLGMVISKVAKACNSTTASAKKKALSEITWRNSKLTHLLRESLSGNCKTVMIAAISPAQTEYNETKSTLRFANRLKEIKLDASKAKLSGSKEALALIEARKRIAELEKLLAENKRNEVTTATSQDQDNISEDAINAQLEAVRREQSERIKQMQEDFKNQAQAERDVIEKERIAAEEAANAAAQLEALANAQLAEIMKERERKESVRKAPHLLTIIDDANLTGLFREELRIGDTIAGTDDDKCSIILDGRRVQNEHCIFNRNDKNITIKPVGKAVVRVNGKLIIDLVELKHNDRVVLGQDNYYRVIEPKIEETYTMEENMKDAEIYDYSFISREASKDLLSAFASSKEAKQKERDELDRKLKEKENALLEMKQEYERKKKENEEKQAEELRIMKEKMEEQAKAGQLQKEEIALRLEEEKQEFEKMLKTQKLQAEEHLRVEKENQQKWLDIEKNRIKNQERDWERLQQDLVPVFPCALDATDMANEFKINNSYEVTLRAIQTYDSNSPQLYIKAINKSNNDIQYLSPIEFEEKYSRMLDLVEKVRNHIIDRSVLFKDTSPFCINAQEKELVGTVSLPLSNASHFKSIKGMPQIVSPTRVPQGKLHVELRPIITNVMRENDNYSNVREMVQHGGLQSFSIQVKLARGENINHDYGYNFQVEIPMPSFMETSFLLGSWNEDIDGDFDDVNNDTDHHIGAIYCSPVYSSPERDLNPELDYNCIITFHNVRSKKAMDFLMSGKLFLNIFSSKKQHTTSMAAHSRDTIVKTPMGQTNNNGFSPNSNSENSGSRVSIVTPRRSLKPLSIGEERKEIIINNTNDNNNDDNDNDDDGLNTLRRKVGALNAEREETEKEVKALRKRNAELSRQLEAANDKSKACIIL